MDAERKRILIVDDEEDLTWSISKKLSKEERFLEILCANSGQSALDLLAQYSFDLVVTDLRMDGISGFRLLNEVKTRYPRTPVIVMTAYGSIEIKEMIEKWGKTGYIEKPFEINDLKSLIFDYLNGPYDC